MTIKIVSAAVPAKVKAEASAILAARSISMGSFDERENEQPRSKLRGIEHPSLNSFRGKPRGIELGGMKLA